jgi:erythromycin esterase-like protein
MHAAAAANALLIFAENNGDGARALEQPLGHRAIGVVYDPDHERWGNYVPTIVPRRYDAFLYLDETRAVDPLHMPIRVDGEPPETYPSGV